MLILGIDTATISSSIALFETSSNRDLGVVSSPGAAKNSESIIPGIDSLLERNSLDYSSIDLITVAIGPGSFTGLRVGLSTAKGLAYALAKPIVALDSLAIRAFSAETTGEPIAVCLDAKRGEVFGAIFKSYNKLSPPETLIDSRIFTIPELRATCNSLHVKTILTNIHLDKTFESSSFKIIFLNDSIYNSIYLCKLAYIIYNTDGANDINQLTPKYLVDFTPGIQR